MCVLSLLSQNTLGEQFPKVELAFENDDFITRAKTQTRRFWARELGGHFGWAGAGQLSRAFEAIPSQIYVCLGSQMALRICRYRRGRGISLGSQMGLRELPKWSFLGTLFGQLLFILRRNRKPFLTWNGKGVKIYN